MTGLGAEICARLDRLSEISAEQGRLTRVFLSPEQRDASALVSGWMREAGMAVRVDALGNVVGRYEGTTSGLPALLLGSHLDTVRDAGRYDGMLGVVAAIACVAQFHREGRRFPFAIEIAGFSDEEGTRFGATLLGSRAMAGDFDLAALDCKDRDGLTMREAMQDFGLDPTLIPTAARKRDEFLAYLELHIEQGPMLEREGLAVGCVTSISGATRLRVTVKGQAGHAGTVPMNIRRDALAGAARCILAIEAACSGVPGLVGTVGSIEALPGATNVIPGRATFTIDVRAPEDPVRVDAVTRIAAALNEIAETRALDIDMVTFHDSPAVPCAPWIMDQIDSAIMSEGIRPLRLPSGAGHDGLAMKAIADIGMIFLRCTGGISHNPAESITVEDAETGARVLYRCIENFQTRIPS